MTSPTDVASVVDLYGDPESRFPVFVVGMNGSGTTMLVDCLNQHPELYCFPREIRMIPHLIRVAPRYEPLTNDDNFVCLWNYAAGLAPFRWVNGGESKALPTGWRSCTRDLAGLLNMLFLTYARQDGKKVWCEKSPQHAQHLSRIAELFPQARFIHMIRDGRDCASSFHRRWHRQPDLTMLRWKKLVRTARAQGQALGSGRYLEVRYEDLTRAPEIWMRRICRFLELPFDPAVLQSSQPYLDGPRRASPDAAGSLRENSGRWESYFSARVAGRLERIGGRALQEFGYATSVPESDETPVKWRQRLWNAKDSGFQFFREVGQKLTGRIERPWWTILSRPLNAYRQGRENLF